VEVSLTYLDIGVEAVLDTDHKTADTTDTEYDLSDEIAPRTLQKALNPIPGAGENAENSWNGDDGHFALQKRTLLGSILLSGLACEGAHRGASDHFSKIHQNPV
jgi:hypothetical protein